MPVRAPSRPSQPAATQSTGGRFASPAARQNAIKEKSLALIAGNKLEFTEKTPKKTDIARQYEVKNVRPWTYTAIELKNGDVVLKKVMTGGFAPPRPGDGSFTKPMKFEELTRS
jgi:hypothetical protein